jgi:hypothetical protein
VYQFFILDIIYIGMKSIKMTPVWMFILLLAILIISVLIGSKVSEGFTARTAYVEADITGYANKVWPLVSSSINFDKANGNIVLQTGAAVDKVINRKGDVIGADSAGIQKLETSLATTVDSAWTSFTTVKDTTQLFYMPWDKTTFIHLVTGGVHTSGFCFDGTSKFVGEYDGNDKGKTQTRGYASLVTVGNDGLVSATPPPVNLFLKNLYAIKAAGIFYDVSSGCVVIPKTANTVDVLDRGGNEVDVITTADSTTLMSIRYSNSSDKTERRGKIDFSLGKDGVYTLMSGKAFEPWILNIATGADAKTKADEVATAKAAVDAAKAAVDTATAAVDTATAAVAAATATTKPTKDEDLATANATLTAKTALLSTADGVLTEKKGALDAVVTKSILIMPYGVKTLIATFTNTGTLVDVKRFGESGVVVSSSSGSSGDTPTPTPTPGDTTIPPPSADSAISEYYKWYWYWNKTGKTASDDYMLKTQIVPPVCPSCPAANCPASAIVSGSGSGSVSGSASAIAPISDAVKMTGSVAEKTVNTAGDILKSFGSGATSVGLGTVDLAKGTVSGTVDLAKGAVSGTAGLARDVVGGTIGLAKDTASGTVGLAKDAIGGTVGLAKDAVRGTVGLARGKYSADGGSSSGGSGSGSYSASSMDPYTYNGQLKNKPSANYMPVTADFSAFSR